MLLLDTLRRRLCLQYPTDRFRQSGAGCGESPLKTWFAGRMYASSWAKAVRQTVAIWNMPEKTARIPKLNRQTDA